MFCLFVCLFVFKDTALNAVADTASMLDSEDITTAEVKQLAANLLQCLSFVIPQQKSDGDENKDDPPAAVQNNDASIQNTASLCFHLESISLNSNGDCILKLSMAIKTIWATENAKSLCQKIFFRQCLTQT